MIMIMNMINMNINMFFVIYMQKYLKLQYALNKNTILSYYTQYNRSN